MACTPQSIIDEGRMGGWQMAAIAVTILLNALDGFDVMSISFAAPGIAKEWGVAKDVLGWVLSMELIGMAAGSILLGGLADRIGRKPTIMGCLVVMIAGMLLAPQSENVTQLSIWRLLTGLGIGGMLAALNATVAEFSNARYRNLVLPLLLARPSGCCALFELSRRRGVPIPLQARTTISAFCSWRTPPRSREQRRRSEFIDTPR